MEILRDLCVFLWLTGIVIEFTNMCKIVRNSRFRDDVLAFRMTKKPSNDIGASLKTPQGGEHELLELVRTGNNLLADAMVLGMIPNLLDGINLR